MIRAAGCRFRNTVGAPVTIPESYVEDLQLRLQLYRRLSNVADEAEIESFAAEMIDRFGTLPPEVEQLMEIVAIKALARSSGETASFYVRDGDERVCLFRENSSQTIRHHVDVGDRLPMNKGAAGLVLLAWSGETGELFERIRHDGVALSLGDRDPDAAAISAPLFDAHDKLLGALTISGLRSRFTSEAIQRFRDVLLQDVTRLEQEFGRRRPA